eukprot:COSAG06_NODE_3015_length_5959_cov_59.427645_5_plen_99_part_00
MCAETLVAAATRGGQGGHSIIALRSTQHGPGSAAQRPDMASEFRTAPPLLLLLRHHDVLAMNSNAMGTWTGRLQWWSAAATAVHLMARPGSRSASSSQ